MTNMPASAVIGAGIYCGLAFFVGVFHWQLLCWAAQQCRRRRCGEGCCVYASTRGQPMWWSGALTTYIVAAWNRREQSGDRAALLDAFFRVEDAQGITAFERATQAFDFHALVREAFLDMASPTPRRTNISDQWCELHTMLDSNATLSTLSVLTFTLLFTIGWVLTLLLWSITATSSTVSVYVAAGFWSVSTGVFVCNMYVIGIADDIRLDTEVCRSLLDAVPKWSRALRTYGESDRDDLFEECIRLMHPGPSCTVHAIEEHSTRLRRKAQLFEN